MRSRNPRMKSVTTVIFIGIAEACIEAKAAVIASWARLLAAVGVERI